MSHAPETPNDSREPIAWSLVDHYLADDATPDEAAQLDARLASMSETRTALRAIRTWLMSSATSPTTDVSEIWQRIAATIGLTSSAPPRQARRDATRFLPRHRAVPSGSAGWSRVRAVAMATTLVAVVLAGVFTVRHRIATHVTGTLATHGRTYATVSGQQALVTLDDGSQALLAPASTLAVSTSARTGTLATVTGQVLFTVTHRVGMPFTVRAGHVVARVLGTTFQVRRYSTDRVVQVVVGEGRVSLGDARDDDRDNAGARTPIGLAEHPVLSAHMLATIDDSGHTKIVPNIAVDDYTAWTMGKLVFQQTPVREIVDDLSRAYGVDLRLTDSTLSRRAFTWTVSLTQLTLSDVLDVLTGALDAHVTRSGDVITIVPGPSRTHHVVKPRFPLPLENQYGR
jgi:transmembrane sensor